MARKKKHEEHENHERWLVSYADFITLLFAFFVVMYSISSVNEGKYRVLSESMNAAFRSSARSLQPIQVGELARSPRAAATASTDLPKPIVFTPIIIDPQEFYSPEEGEGSAGLENEWALDQAAEQVDYIAADVEGELKNLIADNLVSVRKNRLWLEVEINTSVLFATAGAVPSVDAEIILKKLGRTLSDYPNKIHVEGFTDNRPIKNSIYPSNWELSSARAAAVVRLFQEYGVLPTRMASVGYGEFRPIADNNSPLGRARNRRVVIVIMANLQNQSDDSSYSELQVIRERLGPSETEG